MSASAPEMLAIGGVLRCCIATFDEARDNPETPAREGDVLPCRWCKGSLIFKDGKWRWNRAADLLSESR